ncbi:hypothetical protein SNE40_020655 [Patella caerulea]|uniref:Uncharacterized protein n=1 Tax=Patella caerulea TaxID=87958 RepID=A0AAN8J5Y2_PATCE
MCIDRRRGLGYLHVPILNVDDTYSVGLIQHVPYISRAPIVLLPEIRLAVFVIERILDGMQMIPRLVQSDTMVITASMLFKIVKTRLIETFGQTLIWYTYSLT